MTPGAPAGPSYLKLDLEHLGIPVEPDVGDVGLLSGAFDLREAVEAPDRRGELGRRSDRLTLLDVGADRRLGNRQGGAGGLGRGGQDRKGSRGDQDRAEKKREETGACGARGTPLQQPHGRPPVDDRNPIGKSICPRGIRGGTVASSYVVTGRLSSARPASFQNYCGSRESDTARQATSILLQMPPKVIQLSLRRREPFAIHRSSRAHSFGCVCRGLNPT